MATRRARPRAQTPHGDAATEMMSVDDAEEPIDPALREWLGRLWPPLSVGKWPKGFTVSRDQIYDEDGR